jgi:hypothetical protein
VYSQARRHVLRTIRDSDSEPPPARGPRERAIPWARCAVRGPVHLLRDRRGVEGINTDGVLRCVNCYSAFKKFKLGAKKYSPPRIFTIP